MSTTVKYYLGATITLVLLVSWFLYPEATQWEPIVGSWVVLQGAVIYFQKSRIEKLEFSPAISSAHGYVNNFLEPAIGELLSKNAEGITFKIYMPEDLEELSDQQIDRIKHKIEGLGFQIDEIKLKRKSGRPHDVLNLTKQEGRAMYFDFPRTLLSLQSYIDYKVSSTRNESTERKQQELGKKLVQVFKSEVERLIEKKNLTDTVRFVDKTLDL